jgi:signal transduction histidine kinase
MHLRLRDSLNNAEYRNRMAKLEILYETEKKERENKLLRLENEARERTIRQQKAVIIFVSVLSILLLVLLVIVYKSFKARQKYTKALEEQNRILTTSENKLREMNAAKDKLFSIISHDLRSPFATMALIIDNLRFGLTTGRTEKVYDTISSLEGTIKHTQTLIDNLLEWSRAEAGRIEFKPRNLDMANLVTNTLPLLESVAVTKNIKIQQFLDKGAMVNVDEDMLKTVLRNLISNAIKFTPRGGQITVVVRCIDSIVETSVIDTGVGIPPDKIDNIFNDEATIKTKGTENESGTGLGLILCKEFIAKHNGKIYVSSELDKGSKFTFTLPRISFDKNE